MAARALQYGTPEQARMAIDWANGVSTARNQQSGQELDRWAAGLRDETTRTLKREEFQQERKAARKDHREKRRQFDEQQSLRRDDLQRRERVDEINRQAREREQQRREFVDQARQRELDRRAQERAQELPAKKLRGLNKDLLGQLPPKRDAGWRMRC